MFELSKSIESAFSSADLEVEARLVGGDSPDGDARASISGCGGALRAIEWRELTARLNAARELRRELRQEAILCAGASGATFGDAAARFFSNPGDGERPVNPDTLEPCKPFCGTSSERSGAAVRGDAREEI
jgi:hypothetical protein